MPKEAMTTPAPPDVKLILGDCLSPTNGLPSLPDNSIDHFLLDPPYSAYVHGNHWADYTRRNPVHHDARSDAEIDFEHITPVVMDQIALQIARLCRRWVLIFCDDESSHLWRGALEAAGLKHVRVGHWVKSDPAPQFSGDRPGCAEEAMEIAHRRGRKRRNGRGRSNVWTVPTKEPGVKRVHATQKPLRLIDQLVREFTDAGETICDPFFGSGTTAVSCKRWARGFIGWERDPAYFEAARARIQGTDCQINDYAAALVRPVRAIQLGLPFFEETGS